MIRRPFSLRRRLLVWLLVATAVLGTAALIDTWREARRMANALADRVLAATKRLTGAGATSVNLADTAGVAGPSVGDEAGAGRGDGGDERSECGRGEVGDRREADAAGVAVGLLCRYSATAPVTNGVAQEVAPEPT